MARNVENYRIIHKINTGAGFSPAIGPSSDHTDGTWTSNDIYSAEFAVDEYTSNIYVGIGSSVYNLFKLDSNNNAVGTSNTLTSGSKNLLFGNDNDINGLNNSVVGEYNTLNSSSNNNVSGDGNTLNTGSNNNIVSGDGNQLSGSSNLVIGSSNNLDADYSAIIGQNLTGDEDNTLYVNDLRANNNIYITGNLFLTGSTTTTGEIAFNDDVILLNAGETSTGITSGEAGIEVERGTGTNYKLIYSEPNSNWYFTNSIGTHRIPTAIEVSNNTDSINEIKAFGADTTIAYNDGTTITGSTDLTFDYSVNNFKVNSLNIFSGDTEKSSILGGINNTLSGDQDYTSILGGINNKIERTGGFPIFGNSSSSICGGSTNLIKNGCSDSIICNGANNILSGDSSNSLIGGGSTNYITDSSVYSTIVCGEQNEINSSYRTFIGGGSFNKIYQSSYYSNIVGGALNTVDDGSQYSTIVGGRNNDMFGAGYSTIVGGRDLILRNDYAIASGQYNLSGQTSDNTAFVIGNGTSSVRSDAFIVKNDGKVYSNGYYLMDTVWDDLRIAGLSIATNASLNPPTLTNVFDDLYLYEFPNNADAQCWFTIQLPHTWKEGTEIRPHVHWMTTNSDSGNTQKWFLEYSWANINGAFGTSTTISGLTTTDGINNKHFLTSLGSIDGAGKTLSSQLICRLYTDVSEQTTTTDAALLDIDFHYQKWRMGTDDEFTD